MEHGVHRWWVNLFNVKRNDYMCSRGYVFSVFRGIWFTNANDWSQARSAEMGGGLKNKWIFVEEKLFFPVFLHIEFFEFCMLDSSQPTPGPRKHGRLQWSFGLTKVWSTSKHLKDMHCCVCVCMCDCLFVCVCVYFCPTMVGENSLSVAEANMMMYVYCSSHVMMMMRIHSIP